MPTRIHRANGEGWHSDVSATSSRRWVRSLHPAVPAARGDTLFASMYARCDAS